MNDLAAATLLKIGPISVTDAVKYAGASGDFNPLHHDVSAARAAGFADIIAHGSYSSGRLASFLTAEVGLEGLVEYTVRFERPVLIGKPVILALWHRPGGAKAALCLEETGQVMVSVEATYAPSEPRLKLGDMKVLGAPFAWPIERGAVRNFADAVHHPSGRPEPHQPVPLTYLETCHRWSPSAESAVRRLGFDYRRMLHAESTYQLLGAPITVGETMLVTEAHAGLEEREHPKGGTMRLGSAVFAIRDEAGRDRAVVALRMIERPRRPS